MKKRTSSKLHPVRNKHSSEALLKSREKRSLSQEIIPIVGIGASAGGLDAFKEFLRYLPANTGMAFVLIQHLDPKHESALTRLLAGSTSMPVMQAKDGLRIKGDCVYVMPENVNMTIEKGKLRLTVRDPSLGVHHPIDTFFESLAKSHDTNAFGIVLSGTGTDGTIGLKAIRAEGGITFAQEEKSALFPEMPRNAIHAGSVDHILSLEKIAEEMVRLSDKPSQIKATPEPGKFEKDEIYTLICKLIQQHTGIDLFQYKPLTIQRRISRRLTLQHLKDSRQYLKYLERDPSEASALVEDILIHVTNFFRDSEKYEFLTTKVLPKLLKQLQPGEPLRIWIPGCSSGEEVYSTAIILLEFLSTKKKKPSLQIFGTDASERMIERARHGVFSKNIENHVSKKRLKNFFVRVDDGYQIIESVRQLCIFAPHDVLRNHPFSRMDVISCCNLLIYFRPETQNKVLSTFHYSLKPSGVLILGKSETTAGLPQMFEAIDKKQRIYSKKMNVPYRLPFPQFVSRSTALAGSEPVFDLDKAADKAVLDRFSHPGLLVDDAMKIIQFRGPVARYLEPTSGQASLDLMKTIHPQLRSDLRLLILTAKKKNLPAKKGNIKLAIDGISTYIDVEVVPISDRNTTQHVYLILFIHSESAAAAASSGDRLHRKKQTKHQKEFEENEEDIYRSLEGLERFNQALNSANEELQSANEELQITNEEYETTKEELESTNEELMTLNEEAQSRNVELNRMNIQLQEARDFAEGIIKTGRQPLVVLDSKLRIKTANPAFYKLFELDQNDLENKFFFESCEDFWEAPSLRKVVQSVLSKGTFFEDFELEATFPQIGHRSVILNGRQIQQKEGEEKLILLAFEDITERKALALNATMLSEIHHRVKNNLQVIISLLNLQFNSVQDKQALNAFQESQNRIQSMALIHEKLYQSDESDKIAFKDYITDLAEHLFHVYDVAPEKVKLKIDMKEVQIPIQIALPCGLIATELLSNCFKYAFKVNENGQITVKLRKLNEHGRNDSAKYFLTFQDDGCGMPTWIDPHTSSSMGMRIVTALAGQLGGEIRIHRNGGTTFQIIFPAEQKPESPE